MARFAEIKPYPVLPGPQYQIGQQLESGAQGVIDLINPRPTDKKKAYGVDILQNMFSPPLQRAIRRLAHSEYIGLTTAMVTDRGETAQRYVFLPGSSDLASLRPTEQLLAVTFIPELKETDTGTVTALGAGRLMLASLTVNTPGEIPDTDDFPDLIITFKKGPEFWHVGDIQQRTSEYVLGKSYMTTYTSQDEPVIAFLALQAAINNLRHDTALSPLNIFLSPDMIMHPQPSDQALYPTLLDRDAVIADCVEIIHYNE